MIYLVPLNVLLWKNMKTILTCLLSSASLSFFSMSCCESGRSLGGDGGLGALLVFAGLRITSYAIPPVFSLACSERQFDVISVVLYKSCYYLYRCLTTEFALKQARFWLHSHLFHITQLLFNRLDWISTTFVIKEYSLKASNLLL